MKIIEASSWGSKNQTQNIYYPAAANSVCPNCKVPVNFSINWRIDDYAPAYTGTASCPNCKFEAVFIYVLDPIRNALKREGTLFIFPSYQKRQALHGIEESEKLSNSVKLSYKSTLAVYNTQEWNAAAALSRRTLEGITKNLLPSNSTKYPLAKQIELLPSHINLAAPIIDLANVLRKGGNLAAHFDEDFETDEQTASMMIDLLDSLLQYFYLLPERILRLQERIK